MTPIQSFWIHNIFWIHLTAGFISPGIQRSNILARSNTTQQGFIRQAAGLNRTAEIIISWILKERILSVLEITNTVTSDRKQILVFRFSWLAPPKLVVFAPVYITGTQNHKNCTFF